MRTTIKQLKKGDFFMLKNHFADNTVSVDVVWIRGDYVPSSKSYSCIKYSDFSVEKLFSGSTVVFTVCVF